MRNVIFVETGDGEYIVALMLKLNTPAHIYKQIGFAHTLDEATRNAEYFYKEAIKNVRKVDTFRG